MTIELKDFEAVEIRVGTVVRAETFPEARKPSLRLWIDLGELGEKKSSAQITDLYTPATMIGRQVICVCNLAPRQIGPWMSEVLVTGFVVEGTGVVLAAPDRPVPNGTSLA